MFLIFYGIPEIWEAFRKLPGSGDLVRSWPTSQALGPKPNPSPCLACFHAFPNRYSSWRPRKLQSHFSSSSTRSFLSKHQHHQTKTKPKCVSESSAVSNPTYGSVVTIKGSHAHSFEHSQAPGKYNRIEKNIVSYNTIQYRMI